MTFYEILKATRMNISSQPTFAYVVDIFLHCLPQGGNFFCVFLICLNISPIDVEKNLYECCSY